MSRLLFSAVFMFAALAAGAADRAGDKRVLYSWVDEKGITQYGDAVPPQYAKTERVVRNSQGIAVGRLEAQKTPEQLAAAQRQSELNASVEQRDRFLLTTYTSTRDIEALRDTRLEQIADQRRSTEEFVELLAARLDALQDEALAYRPYNPSNNARRMPDRLAEDLVRTLNEMRTQRSMLASRQQEEEQLRAQFQSDIDRYRELRGGSARPR